MTGEETAGLRERIREAAAEVWRDGLGGMTEADVLDRYADALLPVVEAHTAEETALRGAAPAESQSAAALERITVESVQQLVETRTRLAKVEAERDRLAVERGRFRAAWKNARWYATGFRERYQYERKLCRNADVRASKAIRDQLAAEADRDRLARKLAATVRVRDDAIEALDEMQCDRDRLAAEVERHVTANLEAAERAQREIDRLRAAVSRALDLLGREQHYESSYTAQGIAILRKAHDGTGEASC